MDQGQAVKVENLEGKMVKDTLQIRKNQGSSTVNGQWITHLIKTRYYIMYSQGSKDDLSGGQGLKFMVKIFDPSREC